MRLPRYLGTAFDQLRGRGDDKRRETTCCTREPYFCKPVGAIVGIRRMRQVGESAVVGYEKKGIQSAVGENRCCCAYPRTNVPALSNCPRSPPSAVVVVVAEVSTAAAVGPACKRVLIRSSGFPMMMPAAPDT